MAEILNSERNSVARGKMLLNAFGWQGGTIHQLSDETGLSVQDLLYTELVKDPGGASDFAKGWFAGRTCSVEHNVKIVFPKYKGNVEFWHGLIKGLLLKRDGL